MAIHITEDCINCGACEPECPNNAIYEGGALWDFAQGTKLTGNIDFGNGQLVDTHEKRQPIDANLFYIVWDKCTECVGFHDKPACAEVCPVDCCLPDLAHIETKEKLLEKQQFMHER